MNNDIAPDSEDMPAASQDARPAVIIVGLRGREAALPA